MKSLNDLRKILRPLGFTVKTKSLSWGQHATYVRLSDKAECNGSVFTAETLAGWKALFDFRREHREALQALRETSGVIGLI